jgi:hypothetical protein
MTALERGPFPGLCGTCRHTRIVVSGKGSTFHFCELSRVNPDFRKYPPLPVLECSGYERRGSPADSRDQASAGSE